VWRKRAHFLVCRNERPAGGPLTSCARGLGPAVLERLLARIGEHGLWDEIQATGADCLGPCRSGGVTVIVYPEGAWYTLERSEDADLLFDAALSGERPPALERLLLEGPEDEPPVG
jgi:(2Fe-2S) ferredoxin